MKELKARVVRVDQKNNGIYIKIKFKNLENKNITRDIEIMPFSEILERLRAKFVEENLMEKDFQDPRLRAIQYLVREASKKGTFNR